MEKCYQFEAIRHNSNILTLALRVVTFI